MKQAKKSLFVCLIMLATINAMESTHAFERKVLFNKDWKFHLGSVANAEQPSYNDSKWRIVELPHDWSVEPVPVERDGITVGPFSKMSEGTWDTGQTIGGEGWYRKEFTVSPQDAGKRFVLYFEGVSNQSELWINGKKASYNPYAYTSYKVDITGYCHAPGSKNTIVVKAINTGLNSRWYVGSGIFRHVWLIKTEQIYFDEWDTFLNASQLKGKDAQVQFSTIVHHKEQQQSTARLEIKVYSPAGKEVATVSQQLTMLAETPIATSFIIKDPELWSVDTPVLYTAKVSVSSDGKVYDTITVPFGVRTIAVSAQKGFQLNGKSMKLKGGCIHHDNGLLGAVTINRAEERKVELLKANGYNAVRCAHNQVSESFLDACDRLGLLVIHETFDQWQRPKRENDYAQFFDQWSDKDLSASVRRDRNHPSIIMWSIGNEVEQRADDSEGDLISKRLVDTIRKYDESRFTTIGANDFWDRPHFTWDKDAHKAFRNVDIAGYNYVWHKYESDHATHPERIIYGSESYPKEMAQNWNLVEKHPYIIGDFVWTSIDYLGEAGLAHALELAPGEKDPQFMGWPWYNGWCGDIDLCGDKKPQSYYRDIVWRQRDIAMAVHRPLAQGKKEVVNGWGWTDELLSWNWSGLEGQPMRVNVYSRSPKVRLYQDNVLIGEKEVDSELYTATFEVNYKPGELKAVNVDRKKETASTTLKTAGAPAAIRLTADRNRIKADKNDLSYVNIEVVDKDGNLVPDAAIRVTIALNGSGRVIAAGNASYDDMESFRSLTPCTFRGKAIAIVQPTQEAGSVELTVSAQGLAASSVSIEVF